MQTASSWIRTLVGVSISNDSNHYTTSASIKCVHARVYGNISEMFWYFGLRVSKNNIHRYPAYQILLLTLWGVRHSMFDDFRVKRSVVQPEWRNDNTYVYKNITVFIILKVWNWLCVWERDRDEGRWHRRTKGEGTGCTKDAETGWRRMQT